VVPWFNNGLKVTLRGGQEIEISRRPAKLFRERLRF
jgi:DNA-binding LytR/AlgR family response regulator